MKKVCIILIFILALFLRIYKLGSYPVGFLWDEAALGYNAYSILKTAKDEYGKFLPITFKSFGDYKPGLYVYLAAPSIAIFGLSEFAVRFPSAVLGSLTILLLYLLIREFLKKRFSQVDEQIYTDLFPILTALFLAISPWHIAFSRGAWELNIMTFELVFGFYLLLKFLFTKRALQLYLSIIIFLLTLITYQSAKFLTPCLLFVFVYFFRSYLRAIPKKLKISAATVFLTGFILFSMFTFLGGKSGRIKVMSLFSYPRSESESAMIRSQDKGSVFDWTLFHSSPIFFTRSLLGRYFNHFSGKFLFITGDWSNQRNGVIYQGVMYYLDALFLVIGLVVLFAMGRNSLDNFMLFWLLLAPLPAALTRDSISSVRSFTMVIPLIYITAIGAGSIYIFLKKGSFGGHFFRFSALLIQYSLFIVQLLLLIRFLDLYFIHDSIFTARDRLYGYKEMINFIKPLADVKNKVVITTKYGQPYIFYLFYSKYNPKEYQKKAFLKENPYGDVGEVETVDNIEFRKIYWPDDRANKNSLFVGDEFELPNHDIIGQENIYFLKEIRFLDGKTAFRIVETR